MMRGYKDIHKRKKSIIYGMQKQLVCILKINDEVDLLKMNFVICKILKYKFYQPNK